MAHASIQLVRLVAIACCVAHPLAGAACASRRAHAGDAAIPPPRGPATLFVRNAHWSDVRVYLVRAGMPLRLGSVTSQSSGVFEIPADFLGASGSVTLVASPVAGRVSYSTLLSGIGSGDELELTVENLLQFSRLVIH